MSLLTTTCPTCTEIFNNADDVYSTSCGHLFHVACLSNWQSSSSCPQCHYDNPTTHKIYLSFDESDDVFTNIEEMKRKLNSYLDKINELLLQNSEAEVNFLKLQDQYTTVDNELRVLKENINQTSDSEEHFMQLQGQYTECAEYIKNLEDRILQLTIANEQKRIQLQSSMAQNETLRANQGANQNGISDSIRLNQQLQILEQKLKNISIELEKEINTSTQLSIEKTKLESVIKNMGVVDKNKQQETNEHNSAPQNFNDNRENRNERSVAAATLHKNNQEVFTKKSKKQRNRQRIRNNQQGDKLCMEKTVNESADSANDGAAVDASRCQASSIKENRENGDLSQKQAEHRNRCIIIRDLPANLIVMPVELVVVNLASRLRMAISAFDLLQVHFIDEDKTKIMAEFRSSDLKETFLYRKICLRKDPLTESIRIREYMSENVYQLFSYAKELLVDNGYASVFCKNNEIFAKKSKEDRKQLQIISKQQVDELYVKNIENDKANRATTVDSSHCQASST